MAALPAGRGCASLSSRRCLSSRNPCRLTDPDGTSYVVKYLRGLDSMTETQFERWDGSLVFREEPA